MAFAFNWALSTAASAFCGTPDLFMAMSYYYLIPTFSGVSNLGWDRLVERMDFSDFLVKFYARFCWRCSKSAWSRWVEMSSSTSSFSVSSTAFVQNASWNLPFLILYQKNWLEEYFNITYWVCFAFRRALLSLLACSRSARFPLIVCFPW